MPDGATTGPITVTTPTGSVATATSFTVVSAPLTPTLTLKLSGFTSGAVKLGQMVTATGQVTPLSLAGIRVVLSVQMKKGVAWVKVKTTSASISPKGRCSWKHAPALKGAYRMRAQVAKTAMNAAGTTKWLAFRVK